MSLQVLALASEVLGQGSSENRIKSPDSSLLKKNLCQCVQKKRNTCYIIKSCNNQLSDFENGLCKTFCEDKKFFFFKCLSNFFVLIDCSNQNFV